MALAATTTADTSVYPFNPRVDLAAEGSDPSSNASAVSWGAIFAGAAVAAAASLILLSLGTGLGLAAISPWAQRGARASTFGVSSIVWVVVTQLCASALGGYLAGRLRTRWAAVHTDEVYFRDTAHGLLSWAVATLVTTVILLGVASSAVGAATQVSAMMASGAAVAGAGRAGADGTGPTAYLVDSLFRKEPATSVVSSVADSMASDAARVPLAEVTRIFVNASGAASLPPQDARYLGQLVSQRTGLQPADAERRVADTYSALLTSMANAKTATAEAADKARKAGIQAALWLFIALLSGAFAASYTATIGGRERDA